MKNLPFFLRLAINFLAYVFYTLVISVIFSFAFPFTLRLLKKWLFAPTDPIYTKIQIVIAVLVLVLTIIYRKYFYISLKKEDIKDDNISVKVKKSKKDKKAEFEDLKDYDDDELKIYVDKEIKR